MSGLVVLLVRRRFDRRNINRTAQHMTPCMHTAGGFHVERQASFHGTLQRVHDAPSLLPQRDSHECWREPDTYQFAVH